MSCFVMDDGTRWERAWVPEAGLPWLRESSWTSVRGGDSDKLEMKLPIYLNVTGVPMSSRMFEFKEERMRRGRMIVVYGDRQQGYLDILFRTVREGCRVVAPTLVFSEDKQKVAVVWHSPVTGKHLAACVRKTTQPVQVGPAPLWLKTYMFATLQAIYQLGQRPFRFITCVCECQEWGFQEITRRMRGYGIFAEFWCVGTKQPCRRSSKP